MPVDYVVRIATDSQSHCARMERWLLDGHFADVIAAGALSARLTRFDDAPLTLEATYRFASREAFAAYERDHAPRLRADGIALFPDGVRFERRLGTILGEQA